MQYAAQNSRWVSPEKARVMQSPLRLLGMMAFQHILNSLPEFRRDQRIVEWILIHSARADLGVIASIWFAPTECGGLRLSAMKGIAPSIQPHGAVSSTGARANHLAVP
jgi:hypothetical protein